MGREHAMTCEKLGHRISVLYDVEPARAALLAARWPQATVLCFGRRDSVAVS